MVTNLFGNAFVNRVSQLMSTVNQCALIGLGQHQFVSFTKYTQLVQDTLRDRYHNASSEQIM